MRILIFVLALLPSFVSADAQQDRISAECIKAIGKPCKTEISQSTQSDQGSEVRKLMKEIDEANKEQRIIDAIERTNSRLLDIQINQTRMLNRKR